MRARLSTVLPMLCVLCAPALAHAQQRATVAFDAKPQAFVIDRQDQQEQEQEQEQKPEDAMSTSGFFLGIIGMLGGAAVGSQIGQGQCPSRDVDKDCMGRHAYTGALIAGSVLVPVGVHIANKNRRNLPLSLAVSALTGSVLYLAMKTIPGEPIAMAPFIAAPLQVVTSVRVERRK